MAVLLGDWLGLGDPEVDGAEAVSPVPPQAASPKIDAPTIAANRILFMASPSRFEREEPTRAWPGLVVGTRDGHSSDLNISAIQTDLPSHLAPKAVHYRTQEVTACSCLS